MLKINLLPPYINQAGKIRSAWTALAVLLVVEVAALTLWQWANISRESAQIASVTEKENRVVTVVEKAKQDADAERAKIQPIKQKTDFINSLFAYNRRRPDLYEHVASYIYREVWINGMQAEQNTLTMPAQTKSISAVGRFLLFMQNNPDFTRVQISSVPGWPPGTAGVEAGGLEGGGGYGGASTGGGPGGPPPGYGGPPGGGGTGSPYSAGPPGGGGTGSPYSAGPPGGGPPGYGGGPPIFGGGTGGAGEGPGLLSPATPGADTGPIGTGGAPIPYVASVDRPRPLPVYFNFTVTGLLAKPIERPTYLGTGAGTDAGGAGYGGAPGYGGPPGYGTGGGAPGYSTGASPYSTGTASTGG